MDPVVERRTQTILILMGYYLPAYKAGGPVRSIAGLIAALGCKYKFKIVCGDRDLNDDKPFAGEPVGCWYTYENTVIMRLASNIYGALALLKVMRQEEYDILYINSVFARIYSMLPIALLTLGLAGKRPLIIAPRGEFSTGALGIHTTRKWLWLRLAKITGFYKRAIWQASSEHEKNDILRVLGHVNIRMASAIYAPQRGQMSALTPLNSVLVASDVSIVSRVNAIFKVVEQKVPGTLRVVTLGRVCRMKNIDYAIGLFQKVKGRVTYDIYGPLEDTGYVQKCKGICKDLPDNVSVRFLGGVEHCTVHATLASYHVFLLPTLGENFGHVVVEALAAGCAVILSDQTPWRDLECAAVGWAIPLSEPERFVNAIETAVGWSDNEYRLISRTARAYADQLNTRAESVQENEMLFRAAMAIGLGTDEFANCSRKR